jgi:MOSC domain-containing protein
MTWWWGREALRRTGSATLDTCTIGKGAFEPMEAVMTMVGRVAALWRYPVKSMAGEELDGVEISWHGLAGDRRWAFVRDGQVRSGFPWLTIRERPELAHYRPYFAEPDRPNASLTLVRTPSGAELDVADPALAAELGPGVRVIKQDRGVFDTMPLSLLTTQTLDGLGRLVGTALAAGRFRPNLLVDARAGQFPEDAWVGRVLRIGGLRMRVDQRDQRCVMVTVDPVTLVRDPAILRAIARERDARLGVYGSTVEPGRVAVGDPVELEP